MNLSLKWLYISHMFLVSLCASPRAENDCLARLWLRCEIRMIYTAKFYFNTQANFWMKFSFFSHLKKSANKSETVGDIDFILAPSCSPSWGIVQRHIKFLSRCKIFTPARTKRVRKKAIFSLLLMNLSLKWQSISCMFLVSLCASLRFTNDHLVRLRPRCDFNTLYNAKILFHTRAHTFCICISRVVNNIESKFHLRTTRGR